MMAITHAALASAAVPLILSASNPMVLGLATLAINRYAGFTFTKIEWMALWLGMLISCIADTFSIKGTQLFFPNPVWCYSGSSWDKRRLKTGGTGEMWVLSVAVVIACYAAFSGALSGPGGIAGNVGQTIGIRNSVVDDYNAQASTHHVWVNVSGVWATDRTRADGKYWIISADGYEFILGDGTGIYKTSENLIANRLTTAKGQPSQTKVQNLTFDDEPVTPVLDKLLQSHPGAAKDALIVQLQTQQDELRRQLEQSETSLQRLKAENAQLHEQIAEWLANTLANPAPPELTEVIEKWMANSAGKAEQHQSIASIELKKVFQKRTEGNANTSVSL